MRHARIKILHETNHGPRDQSAVVVRPKLAKSKTAPPPRAGLRCAVTSRVSWMGTGQRHEWNLHPVEMVVASPLLQHLLEADCTEYNTRAEHIFRRCTLYTYPRGARIYTAAQGPHPPVPIHHFVRGVVSRCAQRDGLRQCIAHDALRLA